MKLDAFGRSEVGLVRERNEDSFALRASLGDVALFAVADGMGGHPGGDIASALATSAIHSYQGPVKGEHPREALNRLHHEAARRLQERSREDSRLNEMGTTLTIAFLSDGLCFVSHIGDSRLYWMRGDRCLRVTRDHTLAEEMVENGRLRREEAESHPMSNVLTRCLGVCPDQRPDLPDRGLRLAPEDRLILASDGLMKSVPTAKLASYLAAVEARNAVDSLIEASLTGGAPDNVTVVVVRMIECERRGSESNEDALTFDEASTQPWALG